jgi:hypothetical protein
MRVIGYHCQDNLICNSDQEVCHDNYLEFLLRPKDAIKVCYNLDWFFARLCYLLNIPEWQLKKVWQQSTLYHAGHTGFFVPHRYLGLKYGKHFGETNFSDILQYDPTLPFEVDPMDAAKKAQEIGEQVYSALRRLDLNPKTLSSPVSCFQKEVLSSLDLPHLEDIPEEVRIYAHECLHGGWQEIWRQGHFGGNGDACFDLDLVSAYPFHTATLIDHRYGEWFKSDKFYPQLPYGFCRGTVRVESGFSPVCYTEKENQYTPTGEWDTTLTSKQIKQLYDYNIGAFKISSAWYFKPSKIVMPLKDDIETLFEWKSQMKGMDREVVKRILTAVWGKTGEVFNDGGFGKLFNPVWAATIESSTRTQVAEFILSNKLQDNLISIAVDGCLLDKKIELQDTGEMGTWRLNSEAPAFVVSSGVGAIKGKPSRGAFSLNYDWLAGQIEANPDASEYRMSKVTPVTIGNALKNNKLDKLGELEVTERSVFIGIENKRFYKEAPVTGRDLLKQYTSDPLDVTNLMKIMLDDTSDLDMNLTTT